jgi:group I intron endonuclease
MADMEQIPKTSGIYCILCTDNGFRYIGQTINLFKRRTDHFKDLAGGRHYNTHIQRAWTKHGEGAFVFQVCEIVPNEDMLDDREMFWINYYQSTNRACGYNLVIGGQQRRRHSQETLLRMSVAQKGHKVSDETRRRLSESHKGQRNSAESYEKSAIKHRGRPQHPNVKAALAARWVRDKGKPMSQEQRDKIAKALTGHIKSAENIQHLKESHRGVPWSAARRMAEIKSRNSQTNRFSDSKQLALPIGA